MKATEFINKGWRSEMNDFSTALTRLSEFVDTKSNLTTSTGEPVKSSSGETWKISSAAGANKETEPKDPASTTSNIDKTTTDKTVGVSVPAEPVNGIRTGPNVNIDPETRERALAWAKDKESNTQTAPNKEIAAATAVPKVAATVVPTVKSRSQTNIQAVTSKEPADKNIFQRILGKITGGKPEATIDKTKAPAVSSAYDKKPIKSTTGITVTAPGANDQSISFHQKALVDAESRDRDYDKYGNPVRSTKGAMYRYQVMPATAKNPGFGITPARDNSPEEYNRVGKEYYAALLKKYGDQNLVAAAYNAGPARLDRAIDKSKKLGGTYIDYLPRETQNYVRTVASTAARYEKEAEKQKRIS